MSFLQVTVIFIVGFGCSLVRSQTDQFEHECDILQRLDTLENKLAASDQLINALQGKVLEQSSVGSTYIRWGRTSCPGHGSELVYQGLAGGSRFDHVGGAADYLCLPLEPEYREYFNDTIMGAGGNVHGAEYQLDRPDRTKFFPDIDATPDLRERKVPCAVCHVSRSTMIMIPAKRTCTDGWTREYDGLLASGHHGHASATEFICLDDQPEFVAGGRMDQWSKLVYMVEGRCHSLPCPPYVNGRELACVVCTK